MCSHFLKRRMNNYQGDLADVVRATADGSSTATEASSAAVISDWQFPPNYSPDPVGDFGTDPFTYMMRDPVMQTPSEGYFRNFSITSNGVGENGSVNLAHRVDDDERMKRPSSIFSRVLQICPGAKPPVPQSAAVMAAAKGPPCLQISSPRNTGIKRRKSQAKKVVCIPAPAPANSRSSGEIVPSDLWAWRKYGQKPIKGSPYPRGYYRCSSSKGCSARKQVERSRTNPNMLVITYTSEHNHPWPTQRNSLAGSSRSQTSKNNSTIAVINSSPNSQTQKPTNTKQDHNEISTVISSTVYENSAAVKEETGRDLDNLFEDEFDQGFLQTYKPTLPDSNHPEDSFFADLGEIEADPLNLLFTQGFCRGDSGQESNDLDPFGFYDWATSNSNTTATTTTTTGSSATSHGESNRDS